MIRSRKGFPRAEGKYCVVVPPPKNEPINEGWDVYHAKSKCVSDLVRQLTLAGFAVVWVFHDNDPKVGASLSGLLAWAAVALVFTLMLDVLQYSDLTWRSWRIAHESRRRQIPFCFPEGAAKASERIFVAKLTTATFAWVCILTFLFGRLRFLSESPPPQPIKAPPVVSTAGSDGASGVAGTPHDRSPITRSFVVSSKP